MTNPATIIPDVVFFSYLSKVKKDKIAFMDQSVLVFQVSGRFTMETSSDRISMEGGSILLVRKNQLGEITKMPIGDGGYQNVVICLKDDMLRQIALEEHIEPGGRYEGPPNVLIPPSDFFRAFFQSIVPYVGHSEEKIAETMGKLKVKEAVLLLLHTMPSLKDHLFDFSEPHKVDLEKFMLSNFHFNIPVEQFARLTGRSLAGFKRDFQRIFDMAPRQWLQEKRLAEARHLIEKKNKKPSSIYLELGFESLSHFSHSFKKRFGRAPSDFAMR